MGGRYDHILVAIDGSKESEWALEKSIEIAKRNHAKLLLAHVIDTRSFMLIDSYDPDIAERADKLAVDMLEKYQDQAKAAGIMHVQYEIEYGSPKVKIPKEIAKKHGIDLIVCGATGMNAVERFLIGSVSEHITRYSPCDVLIVRTQKINS
ncbi:nucleotide-binding universal stress UspA family protein [Neobacillus niacini]|jgi:nucleotide-binding universal stress UspA family protein|uniref:universal stress protein n=1 Tax=Neobacillus niacini TaxID=86668 RepID=UPI00277E4888|nr:universal stress protein [Neobacillus niacini]MDQ1001218.1 nucleotide-binding universal stress UspA family protein [Neobacillus niacini]